MHYRHAFPSDKHEPDACSNYLKGSPMTLQRYLSTTAAVFLMALGCGVAEEVESQVDCQDICDRYAECYDSDYDVDECRSECEGEVDEDSEFLEKIDACDTCLEDKSCTEGTFSCADECIGIVP